MEETVSDDSEVLDDEEIPNNPDVQEPQAELMSPAEQEALGVYNVARIVKHKFQQGWKFLVVWEGFPVSAATWEPMSALWSRWQNADSKRNRICVQDFGKLACPKEQRICVHFASLVVAALGHFA